MDHPRELELIEYAAGRLTPARCAAIERHLAGCPDCRRAADELKQTWDHLGDAAAPVGQGDLWPAVARRLDAAAPAAVPWRRVALRMAAAVALAALLGAAAGRLARPAPDTAAGPVADAEVADSMHLGAMADASPAGLSDAVLALSNAPAEGVRQ